MGTCQWIGREGAPGHAEVGEDDNLLYRAVCEYFLGQNRATCTIRRGVSVPSAVSKYASRAVAMCLDVVDDESSIELHSVG